jgi:hypothetical protein
VIGESRSQFKKWDKRRIEMPVGIKIDGTGEGENACDSIQISREFGSNVIEKAIDKMKKISKTEFEHCIEWRWIGVRRVINIEDDQTFGRQSDIRSNRPPNQCHFGWSHQLADIAERRKGNKEIEGKESERLAGLSDGLSVTVVHPLDILARSPES